MVQDSVHGQTFVNMVQDVRFLCEHGTGCEISL
jgi:hypothetical protein